MIPQMQRAMETRLNASHTYVEQVARSVFARVYTHSRGEAAILDEIRDVERRCRIPPRAWSRCTRARSLHGAH